MDAIRSTPNPSVIASAMPGADDLAKLLDKMSAPGVTQLDTTKLLSELQTTAAQMNADRGAPASEAWGVPVLEGPGKTMSPSDMVAFLAYLQGKTQDAQMKTSAQGLDIAQNKITEAHGKAIEKLEEWSANCAAAAEKAKASEESGWFGKIFGFVAAAVAVVVAVVATVATGGAGGPLLALAVIGLVSASISLASQISQELGGPALELSSLCTMACTAFLKAMPGVSDEDAEKWGGAMAGLVVMTATFGTAALVDPAFAGLAVSSFAGISGDADDMALVAGIATAVVAVGISIAMIYCAPGNAASAGAKVADAAGDAASAGAKVADAVGDAAAAGAKVADAAADVGVAASKTVGSLKTFQISATVTQATASGVSGGFKIDEGLKKGDQAESQRVADLANVAKENFMLQAAKLSADMEKVREEMKKVLEELDSNWQLASKVFSDETDSHDLVQANFNAARTI